MQSNQDFILKWSLVLMYLLGFTFGVENEIMQKGDQDNFSWASQIFRPDKRQDCDCECGKPKLERVLPENNRIVGGKEATKHAYPWMAAFIYRSRIYCGGSVINDKFILGAAHCNIIPPREITIRIGAHDVRKDKKEDYSDHKVKRVHIPEKYNNKTYENDIALYELTKKLDFSDNGEKTIVPICMPKRPFTGMATVIGWGRVKQGGNLSPFLREVEVPIVPMRECRRVHGTRISDYMLCAGYRQGMKDACEGDSGGPLFYQDSETETTYQIGLVSFGTVCAYPGQYAVYTNVGSYKRWIEMKTRGTCNCSS